MPILRNNDATGEYSTYILINYFLFINLSVLFSLEDLVRFRVFRIFRIYAIFGLVDSHSLPLVVPNLFYRPAGAAHPPHSRSSKNGVLGSIRLGPFHVKAIFPSHH